MIFGLWNILEIPSCQLYSSTAISIQWKIGQFTDWNLVINSRYSWPLVFININPKLIIGLIIQNHAVPTSNSGSFQLKPSNSNKNIKFFMNVNLVDIETLSIIISNSNPLPVDIKLNNLFNFKIFVHMEELVVNSWVYSKII